VSATSDGCARCHGLVWICEQHSDREWPHEDCAGPGEPCQVCNTTEPPRMSPGFVTLASVERDEPFYSPKATPAPPRVATPGFLLFEFVRASDRAPLSCELRFHGESYGWEAQFLERGELFASRGAFVTRKAAIAWAEEECKAMERQR
jgi:hypothetical protein